MSDADKLMPTNATETFELHRRSLLGVAYRMVGQVADAEDIVQEAWLRWSTVDPTEVGDPKAFLIRITTRLAIDRLRRIKARRENYVGEWLPEPIPTEAVTSATTDPGDAVVHAETLSMAMLVVLETLSPLERAVFILREAFGYSHAEIADTDRAVRGGRASTRGSGEASRGRAATPIRDGPHRPARRRRAIHGRQPRG